jgi:hypothetical protein
MRTNPIGTTSKFGVQGSVFDVRLHGPSILHPAPSILHPAPSILALLLLLLASASPVSGGTVHYADRNSANPTPPYTNWASAAVTIQDAVDAATAGDEIVVTNGVYATGGRAAGTNLLVNRVAVDKPLVLRSVNGPQFTIIQGYQVPGTTNGDGAIRCVYLANGASLSGFTLTNGATRDIQWQTDLDWSGGGLWCESDSCAVSHCVAAGNSAANDGGGAVGGALKNCTLAGNSARYGGGAASCTLNNCIVYYNSAPFAPN